MKPRTLLTTIASALWLTVGILVLATIAPFPFVDSTTQAKLVERQASTGNWNTVAEALVATGATIPPGRHVFFQVPSNVEDIDREVLLGLRGNAIRYWGYCFPDPDDPNNPPQSIGFPGKIFLSEAERAWRAQQDARQRAFSIRRQPVLIQSHASASPVHHQLDTLHGGMTCYIMTEKELPIGVDDDNDGLNNKLEQQYGTSPTTADSDSDGLDDGVEVRYGTQPMKRDSDGDGIIDGIEDKSHNGRLDPGETDPRRKDTDGDTLCDGDCNVDKVRKICKDNQGTNCVQIPFGMAIGEDKNFNGKVDQGESDPTKADTLGDGSRDDVRFYKCLLEKNKNC